VSAESSDDFVFYDVSAAFSGFLFFILIRQKFSAVPLSSNVINLSLAK
jgi:hypothetical protein